jgi:hypothetical protein
MAAIERRHPHLQHAIVHDVGGALRPVQDLTIDAILDGFNSVVLAPAFRVQEDRKTCDAFHLRPDERSRR